MQLNTIDGNVSFYSNGLLIVAKTRDLNNIFKEIYKIIPKETKIIDAKKEIIKKVSIMLH